MTTGKRLSILFLLDFPQLKISILDFASRPCSLWKPIEFQGDSETKSRGQRRRGFPFSRFFFFFLALAQSKITTCDLKWVAINRSLFSYCGIEDANYTMENRVWLVRFCLFDFLRNNVPLGSWRWFRFWIAKDVVFIQWCHWWSLAHLPKAFFLQQDQSLLTWKSKSTGKLGSYS